MGDGERDFRNQTELFSEIKEKKRGLKIQGKFEIEKHNVGEISPCTFNFPLKQESSSWFAWGRVGGWGCWRFRTVTKQTVLPSNKRPAKASVTPFVKASVHTTPRYASVKFSGLGAEAKSSGDPWE